MHSVIPPIPSIRPWRQRQALRLTQAVVLGGGFLMAGVAAEPILIPVETAITTTAANGTVTTSLRDQVYPASCPQIIQDPKTLQYYLFTHSGDWQAKMPLVGQANSVPLNDGGQGNIWVRTSKDLKTWSTNWAVFGSNANGEKKLPRPAWWSEQVPGKLKYQDLWAPSINFFNGKYHLYYSLAPDWHPEVSVSPANRSPSAIGLVTSPSLDPASPNYGWKDEGLVVQGPGFIDPNLIWEDAGLASPKLPHLLFGSQVPIRTRNLVFGTAPTYRGMGLPATPAVIHEVAFRPDLIEAPVSLYHKDAKTGTGYYYLFYAQGVYNSSNYRQYVGRSTNFAGPYVDRAGKDLLAGGGTTFIEQNTVDGQIYTAPAHGGVLKAKDRNGVETTYWVGQHYKKTPAGSTVRHLWLSTIVFDGDAWPVCALSPTAAYPLVVAQGSGDGSYAAGTDVTITADAPPPGKKFLRWVVGGPATLTSATSSTTTLHMPDTEHASLKTAITVTATYVDNIVRPVVTRQPVSLLNRTEGESATFSIAATGTGTLTYQWQKATRNAAGVLVANDIPGATGPSYSTPALWLEDDQARFRAIVTDAMGVRNSSGFGTVHVAASPLSGGWTGSAIGLDLPATTPVPDHGIFTISGTGTRTADIWGTADECQLVWRQVTGDVRFTARVASLTDVHYWAKAGVMFRRSAQPGSPHAMMIVSPGRGAAFQRRLVADGYSQTTAGPVLTAPSWVRLERNGTEIVGSVSADGTTWAEVQRLTIDLGATIQVGLVVSSHVPGITATATFDRVGLVAAPRAAN